MKSKKKKKKKKKKKQHENNNNLQTVRTNTLLCQGFLRLSCEKIVNSMCYLKIYIVVSGFFKIIM